MSTEKNDLNSLKKELEKIEKEISISLDLRDKKINIPSLDGRLRCLRIREINVLKKLKDKLWENVRIISSQSDMPTGTAELVLSYVGEHKIVRKKIEQLEEMQAIENAKSSNVEPEENFINSGNIHVVQNLESTFRAVEFGKKVAAQRTIVGRHYGV